MSNSSILILGIAIVLIGALGNSFHLFSVADSGCRDITSYVTYSADGYTASINAPAFYACSPAGSSPLVTKGSCFAMQLPLDKKDISSVSISVQGTNWYSRWTSNGMDISEKYSSSIMMPQYTSVNQQYATVGSIRTVGDGIVFDTVGTDGERNYRFCCSGVCEGATYTPVGTVVLKDKPNQTALTEPQLPVQNLSNNATVTTGNATSKSDGLASTAIIIIGLLVFVAGLRR